MMSRSRTAFALAALLLLAPTLAVVIMCTAEAVPASAKELARVKASLPHLHVSRRIAIAHRAQNNRARV
jgi:hypothetical protein